MRGDGRVGGSDAAGRGGVCHGGGEVYFRGGRYVVSGRAGAGILVGSAALRVGFTGGGCAGIWREVD